MIRGRFAPSPSGRMHLGNVLAALLAWLDVRRAGGRLLLRIEDLDPQRCSRAKAEQLLEDLLWLGLDWDEGGLLPAYCQSQRTACYEAAFGVLQARGLVYPCFCSRAERLAASAPHGTAVVHSCRCGELDEAARLKLQAAGRRAAWRVRVPAEVVALQDACQGYYAENLAQDCGDFIIKRSDGVFAYQLAVVADDADMGVTRVVRGRDLLASAPRQIWLHRQLGYQPPLFRHLPLLLAADGKRLAKRDRALDLGALRALYKPEQLIGGLAWLAGLRQEPLPLRPQELIEDFSWQRVVKTDIRLPV